MDLIDIKNLNPDICLDIRYATTNNFISKQVYPFPKCFFRRKVAEKVDRIERKIRKKGLGLKIFDGYRPLSVQKIFFEIVPDPNFVGDPKVGSCHNRGAAIDLTLVDEKGQELMMPTPFDDFTNKAHRDCLDLPREAIENRQLLEDIMVKEGFIPLPHEWWHFNDADWQQYSVEDISFEELLK